MFGLFVMANVAKRLFNGQSASASAPVQAQTAQLDRLDSLSPTKAVAHDSCPLGGGANGCAMVGTLKTAFRNGVAPPAILLSAVESFGPSPVKDIAKSALDVAGKFIPSFKAGKAVGDGIIAMADTVSGFGGQIMSAFSQFGNNANSITAPTPAPVQPVFSQEPRTYRVEYKPSYNTGINPYLPSPA